MNDINVEVCLDFNAQDFARIMASMDYSCRRAGYHLNYFFKEKNYLLASDYRHNRRKLFLDVFYWMDYLSDQPGFIQAFDVIAEDAAARGRILDKADYVLEETNPEFIFKSILFRLLYSSEYCRIKMNTIMKRYGYKRKTQRLLNRLNACIQYYRLMPYVHGEVERNLSKIENNQIIVFRLR